LYRQAKFLHENTYIGDWLKPEFDLAVENLSTNERLLQAEVSYLQALEIQKHLSEQSETDTSLIQHQQNVIITRLQLSLLYLQQRHLTKASTMAEEAIKIAEALDEKFPDNLDILSIMGCAFFRAAEVEQMQGRFDMARAKYERSLAVDIKLHAEADIHITEARLKELEDLKFSLPNQE
jgi:tetratricopeptide (TPR) repeat protein